MYIGLHVKYRLFSSHFNGTWTFSTDISIFHDNPSSWSRVVPCGRTDR